MRRRHATPAAAGVHYHRDMRGGSKAALVVLTLAALTPVTATRERTDPHVVLDAGPILGVTAFLYRFSYVRRTQRGRVPGASHGSEIPYVFDSWRQSPSGGSLLPAEDRAEASRLHACWVAFAKSGLPQGQDVPTWPRYQPAQDELLDFDVTTTVRTVPDRAALTLLQKRVVP